jgi:hypothetical protein
MEMGGIVFLDDELQSLTVRAAALWFGRFGEGPLFLIFFECHLG